MGTSVVEPQPLLSAFSREILESHDFPACSQNIQSVLRLAASPDASVHSFTAVVLKDVALSLRVLQAANTALYNRSGKTILSVAHATAMLGLNNVVQIAAGLKVIEGFARSKPGMRELATLSLLTASHARQLAAIVEFPRPEEAYLCGLLRNLGEMLVAFYRPQDYARLLVAVDDEEMEETLACRRLLGFDFEAIAGEVLTGWGITGVVTQSLRANPASLVAETPSEVTTLNLLTAFAHLLTAAVHRKDGRAARSAVRLLLEHYGRRLKLTDSALKKVLDTAVFESHEIFSSLGISPNSLKYQRQVESAMALLEERTVETGPLTATLVTAENLLASGSDFDLTLFIVSVLDALVQSGCADRAVFAQCDTKRRLVQGKLARGSGMEDLARFFCYPFTAADSPVGQTLMRAEDLWVDPLHRPRFADTPLVNVFMPASFVILPLMVMGSPAGCLYFDHLQISPPLAKEQRIAIDRLRGVVVQALARKR